MKQAIALDTMALVLRLEHRKLSPEVKAVLEEAERGERMLYIPAMVLAEIGYLAEAGE